jgi:hypothetical protein
MLHASRDQVLRFECFLPKNIYIFYVFLPMYFCPWLYTYKRNIRIIRIIRVEPSLVACVAWPWPGNSKGCEPPTHTPHTPRLFAAAFGAGSPSSSCSSSSSATRKPCACVCACVHVSDAERRYVGTYVPWGYRLADRPRTVAREARRIFSRKVRKSRRNLAKHFLHHWCMCVSSLKA